MAKTALTLAGKEITKDMWKIVDVDSLPQQSAKLYAEYIAARKASSAARTAFENSMSAGKAPNGKRLVFGYNFGTLSVVLADAVKSKSQAKALDWTKMFAAS